MPIPAPLTKDLPGTTIVYVDEGGSFRVIQFDATLRDTHQGSAEASFHPLDINASVTDHVRASPRGLSLEVEVTNTPLIPIAGAAQSDLLIDMTSKAFSYGNASTGSSTFVPIVGPISTPPRVELGTFSSVNDSRKAKPWQYAQPFDRVKEVWEALDKLRDSGTPVQVTTRIHTYEEMVIVNVTAPHGPEDAIVFGIDLVEIRRAESVTIQVEPRVEEKKAQKKKDTGSQATYEPSDQKQSAARVTLQKLADAAVGGGLL